MSAPGSLKPLKLCVGILLLPCCVAITLAFLDQLGIMGRGGGLLRDWKFLCLALGFLIWLVVYLILPPPTRLYVFGHELTHAVWALMMGGKVRGIKVTDKGGHARVTKSNFLITLAPYFFPIYCLLVILLFWAGHLVFDWTRYFGFFYILIGVSYGFHLTFTVSTLSTRQSDVTQHGWLFAMTVIYWMNLLFLAVLFAAIATRGNVLQFLRLLWRYHCDVWVWLLRAFGLIAG